MTKVAICTVNWNNKKDTEEFLESIKKLDASGLSIKTFVVSNQKLPKSNFNLIYRLHNRGTSGGYNDAIRAALSWNADYFFLVNNDILFSDTDLLKSLVSVLASDPEIGIVSPKLYFAPGFEYQQNRYPKSARGKVIWYAGGGFDWKNVNSVHQGLDELDTGRYNATSPTNFVSGSAMLVRRNVFEKNLFWDEDLFAYFDDNDFQERVKKAGFKLFYDGGVSAYHKVSRTSGIGSPSTDYYTARNRLIFGLRYAPFRTKIALLRQAVRLLLTGRPMEKRGVLDFFTGKSGELDRQTTS